MWRDGLPGKPLALPSFVSLLRKRHRLRVLANLEHGQNQVRIYVQLCLPDGLACRHTSTPVKNENERAAPLYRFYQLDIVRCFKISCWQ